MTFQRFINFAIVGCLWIPAARADDPAPPEPSTDVIAAAPQLAVADIVVAKGVENREALDEGSSFPATVGSVVCLTRITGAQTDASVKHVWYYKGQPVTTVELTIKSPNWRTFSRKTIIDWMVGEWRVDVVDAHDTVLKSIEFSIVKPAPAVDPSATSDNP